MPRIGFFLLLKIHAKIYKTKQINFLIYTQAVIFSGYKESRHMFKKIIKRRKYG